MAPVIIYLDYFPYDVQTCLIGISPKNAPLTFHQSATSPSSVAALQLNGFPSFPLFRSSLGDGARRVQLS